MRQAKVERNTSETRISATVELADASVDNRSGLEDLHRSVAAALDRAVATRG